MAPSNGSALQQSTHMVGMAEALPNHTYDPQLVSSKRLLDGTPLLDRNHHRLASLDDPEDDCLGSAGTGTDDMPFPGRLIEAVAGLKRLGGAVCGGHDDRPTDHKTEFAARVIVLPALRFSFSLDQAHDQLDVACFG